MSFFHAGVRHRESTEGRETQGASARDDSGAEVFARFRRREGFTHANRQVGFTPSRRQAGFTLVELLLVIALIGIIGLFAMPNVSSIFKVSLNSSTRDLATTIRQAYNSAMMTKRVHRLVYDLKAHTYWVEMGPTTLLMETEASRERAARLKKLGSKEAAEEEEKRHADFVLQRNVTRKPVSLPRGVFFEDVSTEQTVEPLTEGRAYTHFFPHGLIEQTLIHIKDNSNHRATLMIPPLVGRTKVFQRYVPKEEAFQGEEFK